MMQFVSVARPGKLTAGSELVKTESCSRSGLPGMTSDTVGSFFLNYILSAPPQIDSRLIEFITDNCRTAESSFPPEMWSGIAHTDIKTTTNNCESFHRHFGALVR